MHSPQSIRARLEARGGGGEDTREEEGREDGGGDPCRESLSLHVQADARALDTDRAPEIMSAEGWGERERERGGERGVKGCADR